ncbi:hypothetical protein [Undibacterium sp.]|uniref:hypothetical protein n=1 Tax=Undibacterium sp. TaxID=1914977 RepID=UPI0037532113
MNFLSIHYLQKESKIISFVLIFCLIFNFSVVVDVAAQGKSVSSEYGRRLETEMRLTPEDIERFAKFQPPEENLKALSPNQALMASTENWVGEAINAGKDSGPYTLVVTLVGKAKANGDVSTLWNSGWDFGDGAARTVSFPGLSKLNVKAGERVEITRPTQPTRFKDSRVIHPMLELVKAENFEFESMTVQVWSGVGENSWKDILLAFRWLLGGLVFLLLRWWWVKR